AEQHRCGIAWYQVNKQKHKYGRRNKRGHERQDAFKYIGEHV
ncbi:MAG: hypothetical protein ACI8UP_002558, partial [Porticoccaceae bacterium]